MGEGLGVVLRGFEKKTIFGVSECPRKIDLEAQCPPPETGHHLWTLPNRNKIKKVLGTEMSSIGNGFAFCKTAQLSRLKVGFSSRKLHNGAKTSSVKWYVHTTICNGTHLIYDFSIIERLQYRG